MLTKIKKMFVLVMFAAFAFVLVGCGESLSGALEKLTIDAEVTEDFTLPSVALEGAVTTWTSSDENVIKLDGTYAEVIRPNGADAQVTLTATASLGEKTENKEFVVTVKAFLAPNKITINKGSMKYDDARKAYILLPGKEIQLEVEVEDPEMSTAVKWTISSPKKATIDENNVLKAEKDQYGKITITAKSVVDSKVQESFDVEIIEDTNPKQVLLNNKKAIEASIPEFISADYTFPMAPNENVETIYRDAADNELYYGEYVYVPGVDRQETLYCTLKYEGEEIDFEFVIRVVENEEKNEFKALDYAEDKIAEILAKYLAGEKLATDVELPAEYTAEEALFDVAISYDTDSIFSNIVSVPIDVEEEDVTDENGEVVGSKQVMKYIKPNDDTPATLIAYMKATNVDRVVRYKFTAAGYTKDELIQYLKDNVLPKGEEGQNFTLECAHVTLPTEDITKKFGLSIEWASDKEDVLTSKGKFANPALDSDTLVNLTAKVKYSGTINASYGFEENIVIPVDVKPAENDAQRLALRLSNLIDTDEFMNDIKYFPFGKKDRLAADGSISNIIPLPSTIADVVAKVPSATDKFEGFTDLAITWSAKEEGLLGEDHKLLKQYLRYHEATLVYSVTVGEATATGEIVINVGIAELKNTIYVGGNIYQQAGGGDTIGDVLCQLSKFDKPVGSLGSAARTWGYSYSEGQFNGYTWYIDEFEKAIDETTGEVKVDENGNEVLKLDEQGNPIFIVRYQYFVHAAGFITLDDQYKIELSNPEDPKSVVITLNNDLNKDMGDKYGGNWAAIYHNVTDHEVKIPLSPYTGGGTPFVDEAGAAVNWTVHPWNKAGLIDRENAFGIDGYRCGFVLEADGTVKYGNGDAVFQANWDVNADGKMTDDDFWVTIPAGGYAYTTRTQQNNSAAVGVFCHQGTKLNIQKFDPFYLSPDGNTEGLNSYVQPME